MSAKPKSMTALTYAGTAEPLSATSLSCRDVLLYSSSTFHFGGEDLTTGNGIPMAASTIYSYRAHAMDSGDDSSVDLKDIYVIATASGTLRICPQI